MIDLVIIEYLERVVENCFDDTDLPAGVGDVATGASTH